MPRRRRPGPRLRRLRRRARRAAVSVCAERGAVGARRRGVGARAAVDARRAGPHSVQRWRVGAVGVRLRARRCGRARAVAVAHRAYGL